MAKTNMLMREKRRLKVAKKYAAKRAELKELIRDPKTGPEEREAAQVEAAEAAARRGRDAPAQSLLDHRALARRVPQVRPGAHQAARGRESRRDSGSVEGELVRRAQ